ncbi:tRNA (guanosine(46)-N7)-methyltransferase TrmB [Lapidilactobacillus luobeiensis]|uniref:tRNA (guanosine(46)-N7)-methyltransferase TrmB n=1 Tax=Lapidilactobacillus luobeiensis TaxID=2950371 RepID=UPI0021C294D7|nr:tRNA (guanosine(46)-N7)-methyltransferase TrmB [Lapidilactobacillus luobeiensis]
MRLRNKPWVPALMAAHPEAVVSAQSGLAGHWRQRFADPSLPLQLEIGSGKGQFIIGMAQQNPRLNFIAMEIQASALGMILQKQVELQLPNLQLFLGDGAAVTDYFAPAEIADLYLNFSDPWPKTKHAKRRLTYPSFLAQYQQILLPAGQLRFKTDNRGLFEYSLQSLNASGWLFDFVSLDLHQSERVDTNIETEYEQKFAARGQVIYALDAHKMTAAQAASRSAAGEQK